MFQSKSVYIPAWEDVCDSSGGVFAERRMSSTFQPPRMTPPTSFPNEAQIALIFPGEAAAVNQNQEEERTPVFR